jgi:hypothetical protein
MKRVIILSIATFALAGCSFLTEGVRQDISVSTTPSGANCTFMRMGQKVAEINPTPGSATIRKDKHDLSVECEKEGYQKAVMANKSDVAAASFGNILIGGIPGVITDVATGASNKYDTKMEIVLVPVAAEPETLSEAETGPLIN